MTPVHKPYFQIEMNYVRNINVGKRSKYIEKWVGAHLVDCI